jgi:2'-hydroxyisoflavone reductase
VADVAEWLAGVPDAAVAAGITAEQETRLRQLVR